MENQDIMEQMLSIIENQQKRIVQLEESNKIIVDTTRKLASWYEQKEKYDQEYRDNARYEIMDTREETCWYPQIESIEDTLYDIVHRGYSLSRFGDCEFETIYGRLRQNFQDTVDLQLGQRLRNILSHPIEKLKIGIADNYGDLSWYTTVIQKEIRHYLSGAIRKEHYALLDKNYTYANAYLTRPYVMYKHSEHQYCWMRFQELKSIWNQRECIIVEGQYTRMGVGNDLLDNAMSIQRILCPEKNAFSQYQQILNCCLAQAHHCLFLIALGPTATVLAYDLCEAGYQAVDIGHTDLEYEWFLQGKEGRSPVQNKYNNEVPGGNQVAELDDPEYENQVIARFT